jgi:hypothetical protein
VNNWFLLDQNFLLHCAYKYQLNWSNFRRGLCAAILSNQFLQQLTVTDWSENYLLWWIPKFYHHIHKIPPCTRPEPAQSSYYLHKIFLERFFVISSSLRPNLSRDLRVRMSTFSSMPAINFCPVVMSSLITFTSRILSAYYKLRNVALCNVLYSSVIAS